MPAPSSPDVHEVRRGPFMVTRLHRSGVAPHRVLLIGSRKLLAPAGRVREEALGARIADRLWLRTRRGVDVDMVWELRPVLTAIHQGLASARLWRYDAVVIVVAAGAAGLQDRLRLRGQRQLLRRVVGEVSASTHVLLVSFDDEPVARRHSRHGWSSATDAGPSAASVTRLSTSEDERAGADAIAVRLLAPLAAADAADGDGATGRSHRRGALPEEEEGRQRAVDALGLPGRRVEQRLQEVVNSAREAFGSASAELTIIDRDRQWTMVAAVGSDRYRHARHRSATGPSNARHPR